MGKRKHKEKKRRGYKMKPGEFKWKPWAGAKCPNIHCRSTERCFSPSLPGSFSFYMVECHDCGQIQYLDSAFKPVRPPEGWTKTSTGRWVSPEQQAEEVERSRTMAVKKSKKKKAKKGAKKKAAKKKSGKKAKGEGVRQVVYFSADNLGAFKKAKAYAEAQEQSFASVVVEALNAYLE